MLKTPAVPLQIINKIKNKHMEDKKNNCMQYSVNQGKFNPDKFSPPNQWNIRLLNRFSRSNNNTKGIVI